MLEKILLVMCLVAFIVGAVLTLVSYQNENLLGVCFYGFTTLLNQSGIIMITQNKRKL